MRNFKSIVEILDWAINKEVEAEAFYKRLAGRVDKAEVKATVERFAVEEHRHRLRLEAVRDGEIEFTDEVFGCLGFADEVGVAAAYSAMSYKELLGLAIQNEDRACKLYGKLAMCAKADDVRELFEGLAKEEAEHRFALEFEYDLATF